MTSAYQVPLFCRYDLLVEFDWRRKLAQDRFFELKANGKSLRECVDTAVMYSELCPLELAESRHRLLVEAGGVMEHTGEPVFCFTAYYQFAGDEELWHMNPGAQCSFPDGETFRSNLIMAILARSSEEFEARMHKDLQRVCDLIDSQTQRISEFCEGLPTYLEALSMDYQMRLRRHH